MKRDTSNPYKGYHIVTHSHGDRGAPYGASFGIAKVLTSEMSGPSATTQCPGSFETQNAAHDAADEAARQLIDSLETK